MSSFLVTLAIAFLGLTSASPLRSRDAGCHPNFEGTGVSIVNNQLEWGLPAAPGDGTMLISAGAVPSITQWRFPYSGEPTNTYQIRSLQVPQFPDLVVAAASGGLILAPEVLSTVEADQAWSVNCKTCNTGASGFKGLYASSCTIASVSTSQCVQIDGVTGNQLTLATCDAQPHQNFDLYTFA